tara:strand:+ start:1489 stop:2496 length:1008 start_codon:yes stop_codon:yes gene_type:complete
MRKVEKGQKLNILTFATHERYEHNLCKTGHNFYSLKFGKEWDTDYAPIPSNYHIVDSLPEFVDFDLFLSHTSCGRLNLGHDLLSRTQESPTNRVSIPILRHCHVLPDIRYNSQEEIRRFKSILTDCNSFISDFNKQAWGYQNEKNTAVIEHGVDTDFWKPDEAIERDNVCLSVVNDWPNRDWCCGFNLWQKTAHDLPLRVFGKSPGLSEAARDTNHLREIYQSSSIFYNTSIHSPVPTVLMEAMACGCAIVSTATCMIPEVIKHGESGLISNNATELRAYLELLVNNPTLARKLGNNARKRIEDHYNLNKFTDSWNNLFYKTIENYSDVTMGEQQ